ncbi:aminodeoxychorismate synthase component I [Pseudomonas sp. PA27(2017)]|uniref:aminodeoxychorismate synthase component I n=1 Tax=Pseudomonas sp. PA27(2017) TaxID=1932112 RepID=UPI00095AEB30|nr:aminodeoxychorismate synthase component I [Pseudomonas sp. PA27(2017)]OLU29119.1 aminodeoxychorismate synthase, component I [Pseudomonas sp. PA27(2017)]
MPTCLVHGLPYQADPAVYFQAVRHAPGAVLLDAGRPVAARGRFDLLSAWPLAELAPGQGESGAAFFARLREQLAAFGLAEMPPGIELPFAGGLLGYLAYDFGRRIEALPEQARDDLSFGDAVFGLYGWALISDHQARTSQLVFHPALPAAEQARLLALFEQPPGEPQEQAPFALLAPFQASIDQQRYAEAIGRIQAYIASGDCYQVNYAQRFQAPYQGDAWQAYGALRAACPTPFSGYLSLPGGGALLSLSPERFIRVSGGQVETRPIKGTQPRGRDEREDAHNAQVLLASPKDRAENLMIVDLLRNDLGRTCRTGSVRVPELFALESYPNVHHLVSAVTGELAADKDALDLLLGAFPGGSITGAPKIRAMQIIDELEPTRRGPYCGSLLYLDVRGEMDSSIAIRSLLAKDGVISCWGGGGIVADSAWQAEYQESVTKVQVLLSTLERLLQPKR